MGKVYDALKKARKTDGGESAPAPPVDRAYFSDGEKSAAEPALKKGNGDSSVNFKTEPGRRVSGYRADPNLVTMIKPRSFEAEQFRMLRTSILFPVSGNAPRSIMVTSAVPGEGKSFVSANLAVSIAYYVDKYVLLMDCDMRLPHINKYFGLGDAPGLSEYLSEGVPLSSLIVKSDVDKLSILPGGRPPPNPSELLASRRMSELLDEVETRFSDRYIIIDSPPPLLTSESSAIARQVDGIVIVVKYGHTAKSMVKELIDALGREKILGVVFNQSEMIALFNDQYGKYGKYGKYYKSVAYPT